jgi:hypothetical protein
VTGRGLVRFVWPWRTGVDGVVVEQRTAVRQPEESGVLGEVTPRRSGRCRENPVERRHRLQRTTGDEVVETGQRRRGGAEKVEEPAGKSVDDRGAHGGQHAALRPSR